MAENKVKTTFCFNSLREYIKIISIVSPLVGIFLIIYYCSSIAFYPAGLSAGDTLLFLWVFVGFLILYSAIVLFYFVASLFWLWLLSFFLTKFRIKNLEKTKQSLKKQQLILGNGFLHFLGLVVTISAVILTLSSEETMEIFLYGFSTLFTMCLSILVYFSLENSIIITEEKSNTNSKNTITFLTIFIYLIPLLIGGFFGSMVKKTFQFVGIRQENVTLYIDAEKYQAILKQLRPKDKEICKEVCTLKNTDILFSNIGSHTKFEMTTYDKMKIPFVIPSQYILGITTTPFP